MGKGCISPETHFFPKTGNNINGKTKIKRHEMLNEQKHMYYPTTHPTNNKD
jgi:hypothetical protein